MTRLLCLCLCLCLCLVLAALSVHGLDVQGVRGEGPTREEALRAASGSALAIALGRLNLAATPAQRDLIFDQFATYFTGVTLIDVATVGESEQVTVDFVLDEGALQALLVSREVANLSPQLGNPVIAFAVVPRAPEGKTLAPGTKQYFIEQLNTRLSEVLFDANFRTASPDWLLEEVNAFSGDPAHDEEFRLNVRRRAKADDDVHFIAVGAATIDIREVGEQTEASVSLNGVITHAYSEQDLSIPFQFNGTARGASERNTIGLTCSTVAERAGQVLLPRLVKSWNRMLSDGVLYVLHVFVPNYDFEEYLLGGLDHLGEIEDFTLLEKDLYRLRYRTAEIERKDFGRAFFLQRHFKRWQESLPQAERARPQRLYTTRGNAQIVIGPARSPYEELAELIVSRNEFLFIDLDRLPLALRQGQVSAQPVAPRPPEAIGLVARSYAEATGVVLVDGQPLAGTVWAAAPSKLLTTAALARRVREALTAGKEPAMHFHREVRQPLHISAAEVRGEVGLLRIEGVAAKVLPLAPASAARAIGPVAALAAQTLPSGEGEAAQAVVGLMPGNAQADGSIALSSGGAAALHAPGAPVVDTHGAVIALALEGGRTAGLAELRKVLESK